MRRLHTVNIVQSWTQGSATGVRKGEYDRVTVQLSGLGGRQPVPWWGLMYGPALTLQFSLFFFLKKCKMMRPRNKEQPPPLTHSQCRWMWGLHWGQHHSTSFILPFSLYRQADWWISPVSVFADVGPGRPRGDLWAVEIGQDVFQVFFISSLAQDLLDDAGGDGYSTLGSVFILPERVGVETKSASFFQQDAEIMMTYPHHRHSAELNLPLFLIFFPLSLKCGKYNPIGQTSLRTQSIASLHQKKKEKRN